jgi:hypothetical protein
MSETVPIGDITPAYSIGLSVVASNADGSHRPNVLAVLSRGLACRKSVPFWLRWTIVHCNGRGADLEETQ